MDTLAVMSTAPARIDAFATRIAERTAKLGVVGLGYAGLPLALGFAEAGFEVTGIDLDEAPVAAVQSGRSYLVDVPQDRYTDAGGRLSATTDYASVADLDALIICVPTPLSKSRTPDVGYMVRRPRPWPSSSGRVSS